MSTNAAANDAWTVVEGKLDQTLTQIRYRPNAEKSIGNPQYPRRLTIIWEFEPNNIDGSLPYSDDLIQMQSFEVKLTDALEKDGVAIITFIYTASGQREWNFYIRDVEAASAIINKTIEPGLPLKISVEDDPSWSEYEHVLKMVKQ